MRRVSFLLNMIPPLFGHHCTMYQRKIDFFVPPPAGWYRNRNCIRQWTYSEVTTTENPVTCSPFKRKAVRSTKRVRDLRIERRQTPEIRRKNIDDRYQMTEYQTEVWRIPFLTIEAGCVVQEELRFEI